MSKLTIWFWQRMVTPHMGYLASALAQRGHKVTYVAEERLSVQREALGWQSLDLNGVTMRFASTAHEAKKLAECSDVQTIHITQGLRANGIVASAQKTISIRKQRHYIIMESVDLRGPVGYLKPAVYVWHLYRKRRDLEGVMAIGADTSSWLRRLAPSNLQIFPFAYFLPEQQFESTPRSRSKFRFLYAGALVPRKRVDLLLQTLGDLRKHEFEIEVIGNGPMRHELESLAEKLLPGRVVFQGVLPISEIPGRMALADCLVLPSSHDGWGAVVSEALMVGTPAICSAACGSRGVVEASGVGGVFGTLDKLKLSNLLESAVYDGKINTESRMRLKRWARCLGADAGAEYLEFLVEKNRLANVSILPPWQR